MVGSRLPNGAVDWDQLRLVVFDLDGTLYDQRRLRSVMLLRLLADAVRTRSLDKLRILRAFRDCREELGEAMATDIATRQFALAAERCGRPVATVKATVEEWIERRPLDILRSCRCRGVERVFAGLAAEGKTLAVLSDYPAARKLKALGLDADIVVCGTDPEVGVLKPHPAGLAHVLNRAQATPETAIMIGDRVDRDGAVAKGLGMRALIRSARPIAGVDTFRGYDDEIFRPLTERLGVAAAASPSSVTTSS
ncbi:MAG TPA: HAD family hydrolase [Ensifer sp.]|jgi:phosphoglycolate phosphatase/putative hydrolase of the HAD superfamily|uniref:HAD family hydrolase n=1 Tax=Ensifer sp. TaxID=1872086 RepID=UPI002E11A7BF|nr:HAD family hydrolase [Ensifer sp.]